LGWSAATLGAPVAEEGRDESGLVGNRAAVNGEVDGCGAEVGVLADTVVFGGAGVAPGGSGPELVPAPLYIDDGVAIVDDSYGGRILSDAEESGHVGELNSVVLCVGDLHSFVRADRDAVYDHRKVNGLEDHGSDELLRGVGGAAVIG